MHNIIAIVDKLFIAFKKFNLAVSQRINSPDANATDVESEVR